MGRDYTSTSIALLESQHGREVLHIATTHHLCRHLLTHYGAQQRVDLTAHVALLDQMVHSHLFDRIIAPHTYTSALTDLTRIGRVAAAQN